jgi:hypothetical protein
MAKDAILWNYYSTNSPDGRKFTDRRFGVFSDSTTPSVPAGTALGLFAFGTHLLAVVGTTFYSDGVAHGTVDGTSQYQFTLTGAGGTAVFLKNNTNAYTWDGTTLTAITDPNYPAVTVPGVAYMDGYVFVVGTAGAVWNSNLNTPGTWNALNFIFGTQSGDPGAAVSRLYNYVVQFGANSTNFFWDAGNTPPGSPLLPNVSAVLNVGCAVGTSVVATENTIFWVGQTHQKGRSVYMMNGLSPQPISDQHIDKVLNADPLTGVYAYFLKINGQAFYVLTLTASNATLVYNATTHEWGRWSSTALGKTMNASNAVVNAGVVTLTVPNHGLTNPCVILVGSTNTSPSYLGTFVPNIIDANTLSYPVNTILVGGLDSSPINSRAINADSVTNSANVGFGQMTVTPYVQNYFAQVFYAFANNTDYLLGATDGKVYQMRQGVSSDNGQFIYGLLRTNAGDFGSNRMKFFSRLEVIGDKVSDTAYLGYSDNDFASFGAFRPVNLHSARSLIRRAGAARRRSFALLYIGGFQARFYDLEIDVMEGPQ